MSKDYRAWHAAYSRWYDHKQAKNRIRAFFWGHLADTILRLKWSR